MKDDVKEVLLSEEEIKEIVDGLGKQISEDYKGKNLVLVSVLKGSVVFMADLMRAISIPCSIDFMVVSSYGSGTESSGIVKIIKDLDMDLRGVDLLIVEDILDTGRTLSSLINILKMRNPNSVKICTFLDKPERRIADISAEYVGACVPDEFVIGYGLDYDETYRNLPYVGILKPEVYSK
ncbi:MAG: hypoxanthine phosphoribosyltransferase [Oscillospiraceae bacterium]|nr:hypoxanthine phosphoribosyltransferase [Candidatus Limimonas coprohippi]MCQ2488127.1 hypoxanthine phosphoribosyltransferase [Clostridia bacterium]